MCALFVSICYSYLGKARILQDVGVMCALFGSML